MCHRIVHLLLFACGQLVRMVRREHGFRVDRRASLELPTDRGLEGLGDLGRRESPEAGGGGGKTRSAFSSTIAAQ